MTNIYDFQGYFSQGISTKIKDGDNTNTVYLDYVAPPPVGREMNSVPKFVANIKGHKIDFYLSTLNYKAKNNNQFLDINFFYSGNYLSKELSNKRLVIVEPNWRQLDKLRLLHKTPLHPFRFSGFNF
jgi:acetoacetate decarboxylase